MDGPERGVENDRDPAEYRPRPSDPDPVPAADTDVEPRDADDNEVNVDDDCDPDTGPEIWGVIRFSLSRVSAEKRARFFFSDEAKNDGDVEIEQVSFT
jgi:hypothetical protein